jgi:3-oxoacyl-[acyl-carrier-protein] synthase-3
MMMELLFRIQMMLLAQKFLEITGIQERRYVTDDLLTSDIAFIAAKKAIADAQN